MNEKDMYSPFRQMLRDAFIEVRNSSASIETLVDRYTKPLFGVAMRQLEIRLTALEEHVDKLNQRYDRICSAQEQDEAKAVEVLEQIYNCCKGVMPSSKDEFVRCALEALKQNRAGHIHDETDTMQKEGGED